MSQFGSPPATKTIVRACTRICSPAFSSLTMTGCAGFTILALGLSRRAMNGFWRTKVITHLRYGEESDAEGVIVEHHSGRVTLSQCSTTADWTQYPLCRIGLDPEP